MQPGLSCREERKKSRRNRGRKLGEKEKDLREPLRPAASQSVDHNPSIVTIAQAS